MKRTKRANTSSTTKSSYSSQNMHTYRLELANMSPERRQSSNWLRPLMDESVESLLAGNVSSIRCNFNWQLFALCVPVFAFYPQHPAVQKQVDGSFLWLLWIPWMALGAIVGVNMLTQYVTDYSDSPTWRSVANIETCLLIPNYFFALLIWCYILLTALAAFMGFSAQKSRCGEQCELETYMFGLPFVVMTYSFLLVALAGGWEAKCVNRPRISQVDSLESELSDIEQPKWLTYLTWIMSTLISLFYLVIVAATGLEGKIALWAVAFGVAVCFPCGFLTGKVLQRTYEMYFKNRTFMRYLSIPHRLDKKFLFSVELSNWWSLRMCIIKGPVHQMYQICGKSMTTFLIADVVSMLYVMVSVFRDGSYWKNPAMPIISVFVVFVSFYVFATIREAVGIIEEQNYHKIMLHEEHVYQKTDMINSPIADSAGGYSDAPSPHVPSKSAERADHLTVPQSGTPPSPLNVDTEPLNTEEEATLFIGSHKYSVNVPIDDAKNNDPSIRTPSDPALEKLRIMRMIQEILKFMERHDMSTHPTILGFRVNRWMWRIVVLYFAIGGALFFGSILRA